MSITNVHSIHQDYVVQNWGEEDTEGEQVVITTLL